MLKKEFKDNAKSLIIWLLIFILLYGFVYLIYPSIINNSNSKMINEMIDMFPKEVVVAFNMDISSLDTAFGWFKTEGYTFLVLLGAIYSGILGATILSKEETYKTIEFLGAKPISRFKIVTNKILLGFINITIMYFILFIFNLIGMKLSGCLDIKLLSLLSFAPLLTCYIVFLITMLISTLLKRTKASFSIGIIIPFIGYIIQILSSISDKFNNVKFITPFTLSESRYLINNNIVNTPAILITVGMCMVLYLLIYPIYNKKDF